LENFPESIAAVVLGVIIGYFLKNHYGDETEEGMLKILQFEPHTYLLFLLPPIMFQVGFSMNASTFFRNILTINSYAIFGTFISSFVFATILYYSLPMIYQEQEYLDCLMLGCIVSAIDPVATISIFKSLRINDRIYMIIFGESTLNNAVAIAFASSIAGIKVIIENSEEVDFLDITVFTLEKFGTYFFLSFIIGGVWALFISFMFAILDLNEFTWIEIAFFILSCYFPYIF
jgi:sodium/hydrogen exchanger 8